MKKLFSVLLSAFLLLGLCACTGEQQSEQPKEPEPPELIYGSWYAMPDIADAPVEINRDGTCIVDGQQWNWTAKTIETDRVVLTAGEGEEEFEIEFKYLQTNVPVLAQKRVGWAVKDPELWTFLKDWYNEETKNSFSLTLFGMQEAQCVISLKAGTLIVETQDGYVLNVTEQKCVVTDKEGNQTVYVPFGY